MTTSIRGVMLSNNGQTVTGVTQAFTWPVGTVAGDVAILFVEKATSADTITLPTGWTNMSGPDYVTGGVLAGYIIGKLMTSTDITAGGVTVTWSGSGARTPAVGVMCTGNALTGYSISTVVKQTTGTTVTPGSLTGLTTGGTLLYFVGSRANSGTNHIGVTTWPTGWTNGGDSHTAIASAPENSALCAYKTTAGTSGGGDAISLTGGTPTHSMGYTVALPPGTPPSGVWNILKSGVWTPMTVVKL